MLTVHDLTAGYGDVEILHSVSLGVEKGEIVALVGANASGKSTLLGVLSGGLRPWSGRVDFEGQSLVGQTPAAVVERGIVLVPEGRAIFPDLTVEENLDMGAWLVRDPSRRRLNLESVHTLFPVLADRRNQLAGTLSGGEQQMLAVGRGLMSSPRLIMLDEPSQGLAPMVVEKMLEAVVTIRNSGVTVVLVEQNVHHALEVADRGYVLENGRIVLTGANDTLLGSEHVKKAYLGL